MNAIYLELPLPTDLQKIVVACFPEYKGKMFKYNPVIPTELNSYWTEGSKDTFCFYNLDNGKTFELPSNHPFFDRGRSSNKLDNLPPRMVIVKHTIFCGKDLGITFYSNSQDITKCFPAPADDLTQDEKIVLVATRSLKSSYGGIPNFRLHEARKDTGITTDEYNAAKESLITKGYLDKRGAVTVKGKNAVGFKRLYDADMKKAR